MRLGNVNLTSRGVGGTVTAACDQPLIASSWCQPCEIHVCEGPCQHARGEGAGPKHLMLMTHLPDASRRRQTQVPIRFRPLLQYETSCGWQCLHVSSMISSLSRANHGNFTGTHGRDRAGTTSATPYVYRRAHAR